MADPTIDHPTAIDHPTEWTSLLEAARDGDNGALGQICEQLRGYLLLTVGDDLGVDLQAKLGASDIVQHTMLEVCSDLETFRGTSEAEFRAWIKRLVRHNLIDATRSFRQTQRRDASREIPIVSEGKRIELAGNNKTASCIVRRRETDEELLRAVARLPDERKTIVELRHRQGLAYVEIAKRMNMNEAAARKLWSRTVEALREELNSDDAKRRSQPK